MKKGFTLIELLAVILILGIIALIAIPTVNKIINEARYGAFKSGNDNIMKTIEQECQTSIMKGENPILSYIFTEGKSNAEINVKGSFPNDGYILLDKNCSVTDYYLSDNKNVYSNDEDVRKDYMLKAPSEEGISIFKSLYPDYYSNIKNVSFINNLNIPENAVEIKNLSISENGKIKSWLIPNGENYDLYVGSDKTIYLNYDSSNLFKNSVAETINLNNFDTSFVENMNNMFYSCSNVTSLNVSNFNTSNVTNMKSLFDHCEKINFLDVSKWNVKNVTNMNNLFGRCKSLTTIDITNWDTGNVTNMNGLFLESDLLISVGDLSKLNTSSLESLHGLFQDCKSLKNVGDLSNWDTSKVTGMNFLFKGTKMESLNLSNWNTGSLTNIFQSFINMTELTSLDISNWKFNENISITDLNVFTNTKLDYIKCNSSDVINKLIPNLPDRTSQTQGIIKISNISNLDIVALNAKNWTVK